MNCGNFFSELKRCNVYKVAVAYAVVGWLLVQIATQVFPFLEIPNWVVRLVIVLVAIGFPIALIIAWAFEMTPEGIKRTEVADAPHERSRGKTWISVVIVGAGISIALFFLGRYTVANRTAVSPNEFSTKSIAVLPFANLSHDPDNAYFASAAVKTLRQVLLLPAGMVASIERLKIDPIWDPIRTDPGFQQLLAGKELVGPGK